MTYPPSLCVSPAFLGSSLNASREARVIIHWRRGLGGLLSLWRIITSRPIVAAEVFIQGVGDFLRK